MMNAKKNIEQWHLPISHHKKTLKEAHKELQSLGVNQAAVPYIIQLVENPKFKLPGIEIFHGAADLLSHDYIHMVLGRGLMPKDEAFVIGFTMGSTNRVTNTEEMLYAFFSQYLYPKKYRFTDDDIHVFKDAVRLGFISGCKPLSEIDFSIFLDSTLGEIRKSLGIEESLLRAYYDIEKRRYPNAAESQRLLD